MARLYTCGFEMQEVTGIEFAVLGSPTISTSQFRSGAAALRISSLTSATVMGARMIYAAANSTADMYGRGYFYFVTLPSAENTIAHFRTSTGTRMSRITIDSGGVLRLYDEDGQITAGGPNSNGTSNALSTNVWYRIELRQNNVPASGSHVVTGRVDGSDFATSSTRALTSGATAWVVCGNGNLEAQTQGDWYVDDCAANDATGGSTQTSWPGEGSVAHLHPDGIGDNNQGTNTGAATSWEATDEITPNDATDFHTLVANNDIVDLTLESPGVRGINPYDAITLVEVVVRVSALTAAACSHNERIKSQASGTVFSGTVISYAVTAWNINDDVDPKRGQCVSYTDPQAGGPWTPALLETAQIGATAPDAAPDVQVSALMAIVEYVPRGQAPAEAPVYRLRPAGRERRLWNGDDASNVLGLLATPPAVMAPVVPSEVRGWPARLARPDQPSMSGLLVQQLQTISPFPAAEVAGRPAVSVNRMLGDWSWTAGASVAPAVGPTEVAARRVLAVRQPDHALALSLLQPAVEAPPPFAASELIPVPRLRRVIQIEPTLPLGMLIQQLQTRSPFPPSETTGWPRARATTAQWPNVLVTLLQGPPPVPAPFPASEAMPRRRPLTPRAPSGEGIGILVLLTARPVSPAAEGVVPRLTASRTAPRRIEAAIFVPVVPELPPVHISDLRAIPLRYRQIAFVDHLLATVLIPPPTVIAMILEYELTAPLGASNQSAEVTDGYSTTPPLGEFLGEIP